MHSINPDAARAGGMTLTPVAPVVRDVVDVLRSRNEGAKVTLRVTGDGTRAALAENDLRSVVTNLITNAHRGDRRARARSVCRCAATRTR